MPRNFSNSIRLLVFRYISHNDFRMWIRNYVFQDSNWVLTVWVQSCTLYIILCLLTWTYCMYNRWYPLRLLIDSNLMILHPLNRASDHVLHAGHSFVHLRSYILYWSYNPYILYWFYILKYMYIKSIRLSLQPSHLLIIIRYSCVSAPN